MVLYGQLDLLGRVLRVLQAPRGVRRVGAAALLGQDGAGGRAERVGGLKKDIF